MLSQGRSFFSAIIQPGRMKPWNSCKSSCDHERNISLRMVSTWVAVNTEAEWGDRENETGSWRHHLSTCIQLCPKPYQLYGSTTWTNTSPFWLNSVWVRFSLPSTKELKLIYSGDWLDARFSWLWIFWNKHLECFE